MTKNKANKPKKRRSSPFAAFFLLAFVLGLLVGIKLIQRQKANQPVNQSSQLTQIKIGQQLIWVEIADSPEETYQGLSNRESLLPDQGMLFIFDQPGNYPFVMRQMKFALDFVFILDNQVTELVENVPFPQKGEDPMEIIATKNFDKVLEVPAGSVEKWGTKVGDPVRP